MSHYASNLPTGMSAHDLPGWSDEYISDEPALCVFADCLTPAHHNADGCCLVHGIVCAGEAMNDAVEDGDFEHATDMRAWLDDMQATLRRQHEFETRMVERRRAA